MAMQTVHLTTTPTALLDIALRDRQEEILTGIDDVHRRVVTASPAAYIAAWLAEHGYVIVKEPSPTAEARGETERMLAAAMTRAAKTHALDHPSTEVPGRLGSVPVEQLMPAIVDQLIARPDLLRSLLGDGEPPVAAPPCPPGCPCAVDIGTDSEVTR